MNRIIIALALAVTALAGCSSYDTSGAGATRPYSDTYDYQGEAASHNSAL